MVERSADRLDVRAEVGLENVAHTEKSRVFSSAKAPRAQASKRLRACRRLSSVAHACPKNSAALADSYRNFSFRTDARLLRRARASRYNPRCRKISARSASRVPRRADRLLFGTLLRKSPDLATLDGILREANVQPRQTVVRVAGVQIVTGNTDRFSPLRRRAPCLIELEKLNQLCWPSCNSCVRMLRHCRI